MAWVEKQPSGKWVGRYRTGLGKRTHSRTHATQRAALLWARDREAEIRRGVARDPRAGRVTVAEYATEWTETRMVERATAAGNETHMRLYVLPEWGEAQLGAIRKSDVMRWVRAMTRKGVGPDTAGKCLGLLSSLLRAAVEDDIIPANPAQGVPRPIVPRPFPRFLTRVEVDQIAAATTEPYATLILVLAYTGLRWGEAVGLHWSRVDLDHGRLTVQEVLGEVGGHYWIKPDPKSKSSERTITLPDHIVQRLTAYREAFPPVVCDPAAHARCKDGVVFRGPQGAYLGRRWNRGPLAAAVKAADLDWKPTPHTFRHTTASWLAQDGCSVHAIQRRMGHSSLVTTERYMHLAPDADYGITAALSR